MRLNTVPSAAECSPALSSQRISAPSALWSKKPRFPFLHRLLQNLPFMRAGRSLPLQKLAEYACLLAGGSTSVSTLEVLQEPLHSKTLGFSNPIWGIEIHHPLFSLYSRTFTTAQAARMAVFRLVK